MTHTLFIRSLFALSAALATSQAVALTEGSSDAGSVAIGDGATASVASVSVGESTASSGFSTSIGAYSASSEQSTAVGAYAEAHGERSTAIGVGSSAFSTMSLSLGVGARTGGSLDECPLGTVPLVGNPSACSLDGTTNGAIAATNRVYGVRAVAVGGESVALADGSVALGANSHVAYFANGAVAIGSYSQAFEAMTVSFGSAGAERRLVNVAAGINGSDAVNKAQLDVVAAQASAAQATANTALVSGGGGGGVASTLKAGTSLIGPSGTFGSISNIAAGETGRTATITSSGAIVMASGTASASQASLTLTNGIGNTHGIVVEEAQTVISGGTRSTSLVLDDRGAKFSNAATGDAVLIGGVADGVDATDAVNKRQLDAQADRITKAMLDVQRLGKRLDEVERKAYAGAAAAAALAQPAMFAPDAKSAATVGVASYGGQHAVAVSFNRLVMNDSRGKAMISTGVATSSGGLLVRAGGSFSW